MMIGGNTNAILQIKFTKKNEIGEAEKKWVNAYSLTGWLDLENGDSTTTYNAKIQESSHVFLCDFDALIAVTDDFAWNDLNFEQNWIVDEPSKIPFVKLTSDNARMLIDGDVYEVQLIDDPMNMHQHLEIFLKYVGGGLGVK